MTTWTAADTARRVRAPGPDDDKYARGVVGMRTGSDRYPGAAVLGVEAAWRTGVGMVRYLGGPEVSSHVLRRRPETVTADGRVQAWVVGSGTDAASRSSEDTALLRGILAGTDPVVVDAGALDLAPGASAPVVVTPHGREHDRLREALGLGPAPHDDAGRTAAAAETASALGSVVLLKGARTVVIAPGDAPVVVDAGTPWLATAGTGDVLGGVIGALIAGAAAAGPVSRSELAALTASGAWLHGRAAHRAAASRGPAGGPITALDVAEALPFVVGELLA